MLDQEVDLDRFFRDEKKSGSRFLGQLDPRFQSALAARFAHVSPKDCDFYHTIELPDGRIYPGEWDLRGYEETYLGQVDFRSKRVLEIGPASGWLSSFMASNGAELVVLDLPMGAAPELVPYPEVDVAAAAISAARSMDRLRNSWWFTKTALGYEARAVYADIYELPPDLDRFQVAVFGSVLLHLSHPFRALQLVSEFVDETIVVTDVFGAPVLPNGDAQGSKYPTLMLFNPSPLPNGIVHWWSLSPSVVQHMLGLLGFTDVSVQTHVPPAMSSRPPMFTVVGRRRHKRPVRSSRVPDNKVSEPATISTDTAAGLDGLPLPPPAGRALVAGTTDPTVFLELGRRGFDALRGSLRRAGVELGTLRRVLDFGCGVGRVMRYWVEWPSVKVYGTDFEPTATAWASANLPFASVTTNTIEGPLDYPDEHFDLIYCLSVFTHLPERMQLSWLRELQRILRPGGFLYFTVHGSSYLNILTDEQKAAFARGELIEGGTEQPGTNVCAIFHPTKYVTGQLLGPAQLELLEFLPRGAAGNPEQDSYLARKPLLGFTRREPTPSESG